MLLEIDELLRSKGRHQIGDRNPPWGILLSVIFLGGCIYGCIMGSYSLRPLEGDFSGLHQALYSAIKVPLLLLTSTVICLPSFFVINTILGLRGDFVAATRGILAAQATLAITLAALAPLTIVAYLSISRYFQAILFNGGMFFIATLCAQGTIRRHYRPLIRNNPRHRWGKAAWIIAYIFVSIQAAWVLRPFIGVSSLATQFFREDAWSNAYVYVLRLIVRQFTGG